MSINQGGLAPELRLALGNGGHIDLASLRGSKVVVYFYPKDATPGCTTEAIEFNRLKANFAAANTRIIGVSPDSVASHAKFAGKHDLAIDLASDPEVATLTAWGVWVEKSMYGRRYMGVERTTVLVGEDGVILRIWRKVKPAGHAAEVLNAVQELA